MGRERRQNKASESDGGIQLTTIGGSCMGILGDILKTGFDVVTAPLDVAKDIVTMGGALVDKDEPYTVSKLKQIVDDLEDVRDDLEKI